MSRSCSCQDSSLVPGACVGQLTTACSHRSDALLKTCLGYRTSSRPAWAIYQDPDSEVRIESSRPWVQSQHQKPNHTNSLRKRKGDKEQVLSGLHPAQKGFLNFRSLSPRGQEKLSCTSETDRSWVRPMGCQQAPGLPARVQKGAATS